MSPPYNQGRAGVMINRASSIAVMAMCGEIGCFLPTNETAALLPFFAPMEGFYFEM